VRGLRRRVASGGVAWIDDYVSREQCARMSEELEFSLWRPSTVIDRARETGFVSRRTAARQSATTTEQWFTEQLLGEVSRLEARLCRTLGLERAQLEDWQATRYARGDRFETHHDAGFFGDEPAGERTFTLLLCLRAPADGGATGFPELGLVLAPRAGRLIVWRNLLADGRVDPRMRHRGLPVRSGSKLILVTWARERPIRTQTRRERAWHSARRRSSIGSSRSTARSST
jgi:prolyl 4-hydroxylase